MATTHRGRGRGRNRAILDSPEQPPVVHAHGTRARVAAAAKADVSGSMAQEDDVENASKGTPQFGDVPPEFVGDVVCIANGVMTQPWNPDALTEANKAVAGAMHQLMGGEVGGVHPCLVTPACVHGCM